MCLTLNSVNILISIMGKRRKCNLQHIYIENIADHEGKEITLKGWVYNTRSSGKIRFLILRDGTGIIQCTLVKRKIPVDIFELHGELTQESSVIVTGTVRADKRALGGYEISPVSGMELVHKASEYPISLKSHGTEFLLDHRHLWLRSARQHAILRIRAEVIKASHDFFYDRNFVHLDSPIFTPNACEGTSSLFETEYFGKKAYLSQSGQLYAEASAMAFGKVYCYGPTFRAEKSKTRRHLTEFWMLEPEVAYAELNDVLQLAEDHVLYLIERVLERCKNELETLERDTSKLECIHSSFERMTYDKAVKILQANDSEIQWGSDFGAPDEEILARDREQPIFITHFPAEAKAFYMQPDPARPEVLLAADLLAPEGYGEIIGASQRIHDLKLLEKRIAEHNLPKEAFQWYLDLRQFGAVPHGGYGIGIERVVTWLAGIHHLRETIPFPRMIHRLYP